MVAAAPDIHIDNAQVSQSRQSGRPGAVDILRIAEAMKNKRTTFESNWQQYNDHVLGRQREFTARRTPGNADNLIRIYDNTAMMSAMLLASGLDSFLTNRATQWFKLVPTTAALLRNRRIAQWFEEAEEVVMNLFKAPSARFTTQMHEYYTDLVNFGTGCIYIDQDDKNDGVLFSARPIGEIYIAEDHAGRVEHVMRKFHMTHLQAVELFGMRAQQAMKMLEKDPFAELEYLHWVRPNETVIPNSRGIDNKAWASTYVSISDKAIMREGGFHENPYIVSRWQVDAGETYGRGPGYLALPQAKMLNAMKKTILTAAQKVADPPLLVEDDSVVTQIRTAPASVTAYRPTIKGRVPIQPFGNDGRVDIGIDMLERERAQTRSAFHHELLQMLTDPNITATHAQLIANESTRNLAPILGRQETEGLNPMVLRVAFLAFRMNKMPEVPPELEGQEFEVEYQSPVRRAQKKGIGQATVNTLTALANMVPTSPEVVDIIDVDEGMRIIADAEGTPTKLTRTDRAVQEIRQARAQQQAQQQQQALALEAAKVAPGLAQAGQAANG